jgi:hypothetical protein
MAVFPDKGSLDTFSKISKIVMSVHGIKVKFIKSNVDPEAAEILQTTWLRIYSLPSMACEEAIVKKVASLVREPLMVNELSLIKIGPVRVKMNCRDPTHLNGCVNIFFNMIGYDIKFVSKKFKARLVIPPSPPDSNDKNIDEDEDDRDVSDEDSDRKPRRISDKSKRHLGQMDKGGCPSRSKPHDETYQIEEMISVGESSKIKEVSLVEVDVAKEVMAHENHSVAGLIKDQRKCLMEDSLRDE